MSLPHIQPIAPTWHKQPFDDPDWLFDMKYDGFRGLCYIEHPNRSRLISRNGHTFDRFDALAQELAAELDVVDAIIDGEIIVADETGRPMFYELLRRSGAPAYVAFDSPTCGLCHSASAGEPCSGFCRRDHQSYPSRCRLAVGAASSSS